jgi:3-oxoacyl-[acyl-carrier-protein] synthase-1
MIPLFVTASTIVSALGRGELATLEALQAGRSFLSACDFPETLHRGFIGRVDGLDDWQVPSEMAAFQCRNNALAAMAMTEEFQTAVEGLRARYGEGRIATVIGTSTSGILAAENAYRARDPATDRLPPDFSYDHSYDLYSITRFVRQILRLRGPAFTVSAACASSARAFIDAHHLVAAGMADAAVVGGTDSLCRLTLNGFAALDLIAAGPCQPNDVARDGISIGEAAGFVILERERQHVGNVAMLGYGASSDGYHISSPRPDGAGAMQAMQQALHTAGLRVDDVDYINLHGTGTRANDAMEDAAVTSLFRTAVCCSSTKGFTGHTMGSCGVVEAIIAKLAIQNAFMPANCGLETPDPSFRMNVLVSRRDGPVRYVISNAFGFGGVNCSLLFGKP